jgi:DNA-binding MarR family transcriptional regulator
VSAKRVSEPRSADPRWADLADLLLIIAREIQFRGYADDLAIPLTQSEGMVMRFLLANADAIPSRIAAATGLQRTNLSTVLRGLEHKGLIERQASPDDAREVTVRPTGRGKSNYALVRQEWAAAVCAAAGHDASGLDAALGLLRVVEAGLVSARPAAAGPPSKLI